MITIHLSFGGGSYLEGLLKVYRPQLKAHWKKSGFSEQFIFLLEQDLNGRPTENLLNCPPLSSIWKTFINRVSYPYPTEGS